ncbi:MAG: hypothetical protein U0457_02180 [Candidatus Sericytochromatia bacterium]
MILKSFKLLTVSTLLLLSSFQNSANAKGLCSSDLGNEPKIIICHATGSANTPYIKIFVNKNSERINYFLNNTQDIINPAGGVCPSIAPKIEAKTPCSATSPSNNKSSKTDKNSKSGKDDDDAKFSSNNRGTSDDFEDYPENGKDSGNDAKFSSDYKNYRDGKNKPKNEDYIKNTNPCEEEHSNNTISEMAGFGIEVQSWKEVNITE